MIRPTCCRLRLLPWLGSQTTPSTLNAILVETAASLRSASWNRTSMNSGPIAARKRRVCNPTFRPAHGGFQRNLSPPKLLAAGKTDRRSFATLAIQRPLHRSRRILCREQARVSVRHRND